MFNNILEGTDEASVEALNNLNDSLNLLGSEPNILWYPGALNDYTDVAKCHELRNTKDFKLPDLYIHTDYSEIQNINIEKTYYGDTKMSDNFTPYRIVETYKLKLHSESKIKYEINPLNVNSKDGASKTARIYFLKIITNHVNDPIEAMVLYFLCETKKFLKEVLLKNKWKVSHLVKVNDGCGAYNGGDVNLPECVGPYINDLHLKYLFIDEREKQDSTNKFNLKNILHLSDISDWDYHGKVSVYLNELNTSQKTFKTI